MISVVASPSVLTKTVHPRLYDRLVLPSIQMDAAPSLAPVLVTDGERCRLLVRSFEVPNVMELVSAGVELSPYGSYFTWSESGGASAPADVSEAIRRLADGRKVRLDAALPWAVWDAVGQSTQVELAEVFEGDSVPETFLGGVHDFAADAACWGGPVLAQAVDKEAVADDFVRQRQPLVAAAKQVAASLEYGRAVMDLLDGIPDHRFERLDRALEEVDAEAALFSSRLHVEEATGIAAGVGRRTPVRALYIKGERTVWLLVPEAAAGREDTELWRALAPGVGLTGMPSRFESVAEAVHQLTRGVDGARLACEQLHLPARCAAALRERGWRLVPATEAFRKWQERRSGAHLAEYVLAGHLTRSGLDDVQRQERLRNAPRLRLTEQHFAGAFFHSVSSRAAALGLSHNVRPYFAIVHAGERTPLPAYPSEHTLSDMTASVKLDMGLQIVDGGGRIRACSDIAATFGYRPGVEEAAHSLEEALRSLLAHIRPGMTGAEVHAAGVACLRPLERSFRAAGLLPDGAGPEGYARDCGHGLGKQTVGNLYFVPGNLERLQDMTVGCVEYVWPVDDVTIAVEEMFVVAGGRALPITR